MADTTGAGAASWDRARGVGAVQEKLAGVVGVLALGTALIALPAAVSQDRVRLVPQIGQEVVSSAALSPDGRSIATGDGKGSVKLWDAATGQQVRSLEGHRLSVNAVVFSPDGRTVLTGGWDQTVRLWDAETGQQIRSFEGHRHSVNSVAFSPDGRFVLTGSEDETARLWNATNGLQIQVFEGHTDSVTSVAFSPDGRSVLTGSDDKTARLWDVKSGQQIRSFGGHRDSVSSVAFSPDGRYVLTGSWDKTARLWDVGTGHLIRSLNGDGNGVTAVAFSPDGRSILTGTRSWDNTARLWNAETGRAIRTFKGLAGWVNSVAFSPDGRLVFTGHIDGARLWDAATGKKTISFTGHTNAIKSSGWSRDGRLLLTGIDDATARLWDLETGQQVRVFGVLALPVNTVAFSPDARTLLIGIDGKARLWDTVTGLQLRSFIGDPRNVVGSGAYSPDGRFVLTTNGTTGYLWDAASGLQLRSFEGHLESISSAAFSPDGNFVLTGSVDRTGTARLWEVSTGQQVGSFHWQEPCERDPFGCGHERGINSVAFSSDGRYALTGGMDRKARLWDVPTSKELGTFEGHTDRVNSVAFSPEGRTVITGSADKTARLWDVASGKQIRALEGHTAAVNSVAFSPNGRFVLTGSDDTTNRLWDAATGKELATLLSFESGGWAVIDPEGRFDTSDLDGGAPLAWVADSEPMRALPLEIFMRDYYTPRLLSRIMKGEKLPEMRSIAEIKNRVQPEVEIVSVRASNTYAGRADVVVRAASVVEEKKDAKGGPIKDDAGKVEKQASGLQDLRLFRDGQLVANTELNRPLKNGEFVFNDIQLPTGAKSVTFTAYAFNSERIKSPTVEKKYEYDSGPARKQRAFLVQVGVNHYEAAGCDLKGSVNDAEALSKVLAEMLGARGLDVQEPVLLVSDDRRNGATKEGIRQALAQIAAEATPDDVFFLSFSGHGYGDKDGQFYIFPAGIQGSCRDVNATLLKNAISADDLADWLRPIDAGEMTFVLDSCQSASSVEANDFKAGPMGSRGLGQLAYDKRIRILAASQGNQEAKETNLMSGGGEEREKGLLSYALTDEGLLAGKADWKPVDGKITVGEWLTYAADAVPKGLEAGGMETGRGFRVVAKPGTVEAAQTPAVFDFSKKDSFVLEEKGVPAKQ